MDPHLLVEPFDVDGDSLGTIGRAECFALGVEWQMFRERLKDDKPFRMLVLANNAHRLEQMAERHQRFVEHRPAKNGWAEISVGDYRV